MVPWYVPDTGTLKVAPLSSTMASSPVYGTVMLPCSAVAKPPSQLSKVTNTQAIHAAEWDCYDSFL